MMNNSGNCMCRESRASFLLVYTLKPTDILWKIIEDNKTTSSMNNNSKYRILGPLINFLDHRIYFLSLTPSQFTGMPLKLKELAGGRAVGYF